MIDAINNTNVRMFCFTRNERWFRKQAQGKFEKSVCCGFDGVVRFKKYVKLSEFSTHICDILISTTKRMRYERQKNEVINKL